MKNSRDTIQIEGKGVQTFTKGISPKETFIAQFEFERIHNNFAVQHIRHYDMGTLNFAILLNLNYRRTGIPIFTYFHIYKVYHHHHNQVVPPARVSLTLFATSPYRSSPPPGLQGYIPYPHRAAVCMFVLVVLLSHGHMWGSIGVYHLWTRLFYGDNFIVPPCRSSGSSRSWDLYTTGQLIDSLQQKKKTGFH